METEAAATMESVPCAVITPVAATDEVVERFKKTREHTFCFKTVKVKCRTGSIFDPHASQRAAEEHAKKFKLAETLKVKTGNQQMSSVNTVVVEQHPPFHGCTHFQDPDDMSRVCCISDEDAKDDFRRDGWEEFSVDHANARPAVMPRCARAVTADSNDNTPLESIAAPASLSIPSHWMKRWKSPEHNDVQSIAHSMEIKMHDKDANIACSPLRLWTDDKRVAVNKRMKAWDTKHVDWFKACWCANEAPEFKEKACSEIDQPLGTLTKKATKLRKERCRLELPQWFDLASGIANHKGND